jgi:hypothetical protein
MSLSELLSASLAAHQQSLPGKNRRRDISALTRARDLRLAALALDPEMTDPAWNQGKASHADLMAFYDTQLSRSKDDLERVAIRHKSVAYRRAVDAQREKR